MASEATIKSVGARPKPTRESFQDTLNDVGSQEDINLGNHYQVKF